MQIKYKNKAYKALLKIPSQDLKKIRKKISLLETHPFLGKKLEGELLGFYTLRAWPYRIVYSVDGKVVKIHTIAHRQSVYS